MTAPSNFRVSKGLSTSSLSNMVGLNITDDINTIKTDISFNNGNLNINNNSGTLTIGSNNTTAITVDTNNVTISGKLTIAGITEFVNSTVTLLSDPIITLGGISSPTTNDGKDRGIEFFWHDGTSAKTGFFGFQRSSGYFTFIPDGTNTSETYSGTIGDIQAANFHGNLIGNASSASSLQTARTISLSGDVSGSVSFDGSNNSNITTELSTSTMALPGIYRSVTVNSKGLVTAGTNPTTLSGYGIADAAPITSPTFIGTVTTSYLTVTGSPGIFLNNDTSNLILFNTIGTDIPTFTNRSTGTKIVLSSQLSTSSVDYAIGIGSNQLWNSVPALNGNFKWYAGTTLAATLNGSGYFTTPGIITGSNLVASSGTIKSDGAIYSGYGSSATGTLYFGNNTSKSLSCNGTDYTFSTGGLTVNGATTATGAITGAGVISNANMRTAAASASTSGTLYFGYGNKYLTCDGTHYSFSSGNLNINGWINTPANDVGGITPSRVLVEQNSDNYLRYQSLPNFYNGLNRSRFVNNFQHNGRMTAGKIYNFYWPWGATTWYLPSQANVSMGDTVTVLSMDYIGGSGGWSAAHPLYIACDAGTYIANGASGETFEVNVANIKCVTFICNYNDGNVSWSISV